MERQYFEDDEECSVHEFGSIAVEEQDIINFAKRYDPQVFHTDPVEATRTVFGGLVASGWHTAALAMRLIVDHWLSHVASLGSLGVDELRWLKPVRPGTMLSLRVTIVETFRSRKKPDRGIVRSFVETMNQDHEIVMSWKATNMLQCRDASIGTP